MNFDIPTLDAATGGVFGAITSSERTTRVRRWLDTNPSAEMVQAVYKELSTRDKGAARHLREKLDEVKKAKGQDVLAAEWQTTGEALMALPRMNMADAMAWQRDAAKAGAPLSKEPLASLKAKLADRVSKIEHLQQNVAVQRESASMFAQRLDTLSTKPLSQVTPALTSLQNDFALWSKTSAVLQASPQWSDIDAKLPPQLDAAQTKLVTVWQAFSAVLAQAEAALTDSAAPLPPVPVWADEIRTARGQAAVADKPSTKLKIDPEQRKAAHAVVEPILVKLETELNEGHGKATAGAASSLRQALKEHGAWIDARLDAKIHAALGAAGELEGWQRWRADQIRQELLAQAQQLQANPRGGRKQQDAIRTLREQWKAADQGGIPNHGLWKRFDDACNEAHKIVEEWLVKVKAQSAAVIETRLAMIEELKAWCAEHVAADKPDLRLINRSLHQFSDRWREAGHLSERDFEPLLKSWKETYKAASAPLDAAQKGSIACRQELIAQSKALSEKAIATGDLRISEIKNLQALWATEAQSVPLDRKQEQKLWDAFKKPIDDAFARKDEARQNARKAELDALSTHDKTVLAASEALEEANKSGDAGKIQAAMQALQVALRGEVKSEGEAKPAVESKPVVEVKSASAIVADGDVTSEAAPETPVAEGVTEPAVESIPEPVKVIAPPKPVVAVRRGDDRVASKPAAAPSKFGSKFGDKGGKPAFGDKKGFDSRDSREPREPRAPRLSDAAFHAQRVAIEAAEAKLRQFAAAAHGEVVSQVLEAWRERNVEKLPTQSTFGKRLNAMHRTNWAKAIEKGLQPSTAKDVPNLDEALLRLEVASGVPTPADFQAAKRAYQLKLLTQRNAPAPLDTWGRDVAVVLTSTHDDVAGKRLQAVLKALMR